MISAYKRSDEVNRTTSGNLEQPDEELVCRWAGQPWKHVYAGLIQSSVRIAGLSKCILWIIWKHNVHGNYIQQLWFNFEITETKGVE